MSQSLGQNRASQLTSDISPQEQASCTNCGASLSGQYCHQCGQSSRSMIKFFGEVVKELLDDMVGYDSRLKHTLVPLIFQPGKLTLEYIKGRRFYYVMPFRLYLFTSLFFILALQLNTDPSKLIQSGNNNIKITSEENLNDINSELKQNANLDVSKEFSINQDKSEQNFNDISVGESGFLKEFTEEIESKSKGWIQDPKPLIDELFQLLPYMMFILLPIFAIILKLFYIFSKRFYVEHLIFSLHNHCFLYAAILLSLLVNYLQQLVSPVEHWVAQSTASMLELCSVLLFIWMVIYIVIATKNVYRQSWAATISKVMVLGFIYVTLLSIGLVTTLAVGAYLA